MAITNGYCSTAELGEVLGVPTDDLDDDARFEAAIETASRQIEEWVGRRFWIDTTATVRVYAPIDAYDLDIADVGDVTGMVVKLDTSDDGTFDTTLARDTDYILEPLNAEYTTPARPWNRISMLDTWVFPTSHRRPSVQVTALHGWPAIPPAVKQACLIQAKLVWKSTSGTYAGFQLAADVGIVMRTPALDPVAQGLLSDFRAVWVG